MKKTSEKKTCFLCNQTSTTHSVDICKYGDWMTKKDITVHYYCLLLSSNLPQNGKDTGGILGFLINDIRREKIAAESRVCAFCSANCATIKCSKCTIYFHLSCGRSFGCLYTFAGDFASFCDVCRPLSDAQKRDLQKFDDLYKNNRCIICKESMGRYRLNTHFLPTCCQGDYMHSVCVQQFALEKGYYLRCILCGDKSFRDTVRMQGIYVPDRDATIEIENRFSDLYVTNRNCEMDTCHCPYGRSYKNATRWLFICCKLCGSVAAHNPVCALNDVNANEMLSEFVCSICKAVEQTSNEDKCTGSALISSEQFCAENQFAEQSNAKKSLSNDVASQLPTNFESNEIESNGHMRTYFEFTVCTATAEMNCTGQQKIRFPKLVSRSKRKSIDAMELPVALKVIERTDDRGIYEKVDEIVAEHKRKQNNGQSN